MPVHPFDFQVNPHVFSTPELEALFDEQAVLQRWLDFEAALAAAQGKLGIIPADAATEIQAQAKLEHIDLDSVREGYSKSRNSVVPLLSGLRRACRNGHGEYVHYGATTQDVLDTGQILALQQILKILYRDLLTLEEMCLKLAEEHRATPMVARTHGQQALPTTFGLKVAGWLAEIRRHIQRVKHLQTTVCVGCVWWFVGLILLPGRMICHDTVVHAMFRDNIVKHNHFSLLCQLSEGFSRFFPPLKLRELEPIPSHIALVQTLQAVGQHGFKGFFILFHNQFINELLNILRR